jgi:hypothetical protein
VTNLPHHAANINTRYKGWCVCFSPPNTDENYKHHDFENGDLIHKLSTPITVTTGRAGRAKDRDSNPRRGKDFFLLQNDQTGCEVNPSF